MDEGLDIDALLDGQIADINPNTEEIIQQLLEELVGYVEESDMIPSDEEIDIDDIPGGFDLELSRDAIADLVSREVVDNILSQIERRGNRYPAAAAGGPMLELPIEDDLSLLPRDPTSARKKQRLSRGPPTRRSGRERPTPTTRYINDPMSTSGAYDDWEKLGRKREGGKRRKYSKKR